MADRRGRSRTRIKSKSNVNDPRNWTKAKLCSKLQDLGIQTPRNFSRTVLVDLYLKQNESSRPALSEQTTVTTETESTLTADGAHGTPTQTEHPVLMAQDTEAHSFMDCMKTESTLPQRRNRKRRITATATATTSRPASSLFNKMLPAVKIAKYTGDSTTDLPTVEILEKSYTIVLGEQVKLECSISGTSRKTTVSWQRILPEGKTVTLNIDEIKYTGSKLNNPHLVINNIKKDDEGDYVCTVSNTHGKGQSATTTLKVKGGLPTLSMSQAEHYTNEGEAAVLKCYISAKPEANAITWFKKEGKTEREIKPDHEKYIGGNDSALVIDKTIKLKDEGTYICEADNIAGSGSNSVLLKIKSKTEHAETIAEPAAQNQDIFEAQDEKIITRHSEMVNELANHLYPKAPCWKSFKQMLSAVLRPVDLEKDNVHDYVVKLMNDEIIDYGEYTYLKNKVTKVNRRVSRIIKKAESDIKAMKGGERPNETASKLECKLNGDFKKGIPERCTSQVKEQFPETEDRITGIGDSGSINLKFTISEAKTPHQLSALYLAETLKTKLENRQIVLKDEADVPLVLNSTPKVIPAANSTDMPTIRLSRGSYRFTEGKVAILKCVVVSTAEIKSVQWFRVKEGESQALCSDNEKYLGGTPNSPSLAITQVTKSDRGIYLCRAKNSADEVASDFAFVEIICIDEQKEDLSAVNEEESSVSPKDYIRDVGISMEEEVGSIKEAICTIKRDIEAIKQLASAKMESTTDKENETSNKGEVTSRKKYIRPVKKKLGVITRSAMKRRYMYIQTLGINKGMIVLSQ